MPRDLAGCHRQARHAASTPAHAGPTPPVRSTTTTSSLYPRARGADSTWASVAIMHAPLPPRTRGRRHPVGGGARGPTSTPAHAGPTHPPQGRLPAPRLYPRARGADGAANLLGRPRSPLPPRTRGRLDVGAVVAPVLASTPAHAGPTSRRPWNPPPGRLYPRARGADSSFWFRGALTLPLPPRTRGRLCGGRLRPAGRASTPAHAGPTPARRVWLPAPRPLPPRTRGRPRRPSSTSGRTPSTPAHAGPTRPWPGLARRAGLYPRARGADRAHRTRLGGLEPLPPRTRGRRSNCWGRPGSTASTPAHAGPTWDSRLPEETAALYPRARGADAHFRFLSVGVVPLPPRTRGRRWLVFTVTSWVASTPAHAGPTRSSSPSSRSAYLYPRARGADSSLSARSMAGSPLPPRTRGRPEKPGPAERTATSTPAHAGPTRRAHAPVAS